MLVNMQAPLMLFIIAPTISVIVFACAIAYLLMKRFYKILYIYLFIVLLACPIISSLISLALVKIMAVSGAEGGMYVAGAFFYFFLVAITICVILSTLITSIYIRKSKREPIVQSGEWLGHPKGLYILAFSEMWERFCYYGMRCILIYYMMKQLLFAQEKASYIYGIYTATAYFIPFFGGFLADRVLGQRRSVLIGAVIMAIGEFVLMSPSLFYLGLGLMALGTGLFKPNVSTQVGSLYAAGDHRRDRAFNIFYMGINVGAILSPFICGTLGELYGWKWGFFSAGIGLILGMIVYIWGQKYLAPDLITKKKDEIKEPVKTQALTRDDYLKLSALLVLCILNIVYWGAYEQQGNTLALWMDDNTDRFVFGWQMPATWFQNFNPIMIVAFIPMLTWLWTWQDKRKKEPSSIGKMAIACFLLGISFLILIPAVWQYNTAGKASLWWLVLSTFVLSISEIYLSPIGLSLVTKLSPPRIVSTIMGVWFLSWAGGQLVCGYIGSFYEKMPKDRFFGMIALLCIATGLVMWVLLKPLKRAIGHGKEAAADV